jgi:predicted O-methyltransferase YrrM
MNPVIEEIYRTKSTLTADGQRVKLGSAISKKGGYFIYERIREKVDAIKTLEVGCAQGLSSLTICDALKDRSNAHHFIIDPFQSTDWKGAGIAALQRAGFQRYTFIEQLSEIALPSLLQTHESSFDLIFIDGWHTFDHTLVDCFYALRLLKIGGYLIVDDCNMPPIAKVIRYLSNYPCLKITHKNTDYPSDPFKHGLCRIASILPVPMDFRARLPKYLQRRAKQLFRRPSMVCFMKIAPDTRKWNWYRVF